MISMDRTINQFLAKLAAEENACWKGYTQVGMKMKGGREVPNCVPAKGVPKPKAKAEKKAYGYRDDYSDLDRWLAGGRVAGFPKDKAIQATKLLGDIAAKHQLGISFKPDKYFNNNTYDVAQAIKALESDSDDLPNFYELQSLDPNKKVEWNKVDAELGEAVNNLMQDHAWNSEEAAYTPKQSAAQDSSNFGTESIVDVPIKCTPGFGCKRYFTPQEQEEIDLAKAQIFPTLFPTSGDPVSSQMSSPAWSGIGHGALGALLGAAAGGGVGKLTGANLPLSLALGGLVGGLGGGLYGYGTKAHKNKELQNLIQEMPVGADIGDIDLFNDPRLKAQMARDFQRQLVRKGLMG